MVESNGTEIAAEHGDPNLRASMAQRLRHRLRSFRNSRHLLMYGLFLYVALMIGGSLVIHHRNSLPETTRQANTPEVKTMSNTADRTRTVWDQTFRVAVPASPQGAWTLVDEYLEGPVVVKIEVPLVEEKPRADKDNAVVVGNEKDRTPDGKPSEVDSRDATPDAGPQPAAGVAQDGKKPVMAPPEGRQPANGNTSAAELRPQTWEYAEGKSCTADGDPRSTLWSSNAIFSEAPVGALIAKIGGSAAGIKDGEIRLVGHFAVLKFAKNFSGPLYLTINDELAGLPTNSGSLQVTISYKRVKDDASSPTAQETTGTKGQ